MNVAYSKFKKNTNNSSTTIENEEFKDYISNLPRNQRRKAIRYELTQRHLLPKFQEQVLIRISLIITIVLMLFISIILLSLFYYL